jgi:hypothetical protein
MPKEYRRDITLAGGRSGEKVRDLIGPPNSYVRRGGDGVFETDAQGRIIRDITLARVKVRHSNPAPSGKLFEVMRELDPPVSKEDIAVLREMGILKE